MTNFYYYDKIIYGSQSQINGERADYSRELFNGSDWSYSGNLFGQVIRSNVPIEDNQESSKFEGGYNTDQLYPNFRVGGITEQSIKINGTSHAASYDYNFAVIDENFKIYTIAVIDVDLDNSKDFSWNNNPGQEIIEGGYYSRLSLN